MSDEQRKAAESVDPPRNPHLWTVSYTNAVDHTIVWMGEIVDQINVPQEEEARIAVNAPPGYTFDRHTPIVWENDVQPADLSTEQLSSTQVVLRETNTTTRTDGKTFQFRPIFEQDIQRKNQPFAGGDPTIFNEGTG